MIMNVENIDINSKKNMKRLVKKYIRKLEKEYRDCKTRLDINETL